MAVEAARGCGYRKVGGLYLVGGGLGSPCDRLPLAIEPCPCCGETLRFNRGLARFQPFQLFGNHDSDICSDSQLCPACWPEIQCEDAFLMWVGAEYSPASFIVESAAQGVSKRIKSIPRDLILGESWVWLAMLNIIPPNGQKWLASDLEERKRGYGPGIFYCFRPSALEKIITESQASPDTIQELELQGITPVVVPDDDPDHCPRRRKNDLSSST